MSFFKSIILYHFLSLYYILVCKKINVQDSNWNIVTRTRNRIKLVLHISTVVYTVYVTAKTHDVWKNNIYFTENISRTVGRVNYRSFSPQYNLILPVPDTTDEWVEPPSLYCLEQNQTTFRHRKNNWEFGQSHVFIVIVSIVVLRHPHNGRM